MKNPKKYSEWMLLLLIFLFFHQSIAIDCLDRCSCTWVQTNLKVVCSGLNLTEVPDFGELPIETLDLSDNQLRVFPSELSMIETLVALDLSNNFIQRLDSDSLQGFNTLKYLLLSNNAISNWMDMYPNEALVPATNLHTLSLAGNPISSFSSNHDKIILISKTLEVLDLSNCRISKVSGEFVLQGLVKLQRLMLSGNPLVEVTQLSSKSLQILDLSNCGLNTLHPTFFDNLPSVISVDLSRNPRLSFELEGEFAGSDSLRRIDLSYCNLDKANLHGFPNLTKVILKRNMIRELNHQSFEFNTLIEYLDLSNNAISVLDVTSFKRLRNLRYLELSFNTIPRLDRDIFKYNEILTVVNLSKNYLSRFSKINAKSILSLNMSWCEIISIDRDAFNGMPQITLLDLSNNFLSTFPDILKSTTLQVLDLSTCRLSAIRNSTFRNFPELSKLNLAGNRFTTTFHVDYFKFNPYLTGIWLGDNPWNCHCNDRVFFEFYEYLVENPPKIGDRKHLRCANPVQYYGYTWETACYTVWHPGHSSMGNTEKIWTIGSLSVIFLCGSYFVYMCVKKCIRGRKRNRNERERLRNLEEQRRIMLENRSILAQEAQQNAPDPREVNPPCYEEAIHMPRLSYFKSMIELSTRRSKRRNPQDDDYNNEEDNNEPDIVNTHRSRSQQVLSVVPTESPDNLTTATVRRTRGRNSVRRRNSELLSTVFVPQPQIGQPPVVTSVAQQSAEHIQNFQSCENSPYSRRKAKKLNEGNADEPDSEIAKDSLEQITNFHGYQNSPYARRKVKKDLKKDILRHSASATEMIPEGQKFSPEPSSERTNEPGSESNSVHIVDNYFNRPEVIRRDSESSFEDIESAESKLTGDYGSNRSSISSNLVIVHQQPKATP